MALARELWERDELYVVSGFPRKALKRERIDPDRLRVFYQVARFALQGQRLGQGLGGTKMSSIRFERAAQCEQVS